MNAIQEERVKGYFISAAKDLIRGEGLAVVSARNVAERAGYSYATLYNYFKDIRDLIFSCIEDFSRECGTFVTTQSSGIVEGKGHLIAITMNYVKFFIQYPGIFDLFFQQRASTISTRNSNLPGIYLLFDSLTEQDWDVLKTSNKENNCAKIELKRECHKLSLHGLLMLYLNSRVEYRYQALMDKVVKLTEFSVS